MKTNKKNLSFEQIYLNIIREQAEAPATEDDGLTTITIKTSDQALIDALQSFESVSFTIPAEDPDEEPTVVDISKDSFAAVDVAPAAVAECNEDDDVSEDDDTCPECGKNPCECNKDNDAAECNEDDDVSEDDDACPECGKNPCECNKDNDADECNEDDDVAECDGGCCGKKNLYKESAKFKRRFHRK